MLDKPTNLNPDLVAEALEGLSAKPKFLSPKWFYDEVGSALFEEITALPEYYPTRTETAILTQRAPDLAQLADAQTVLVELGSGASVKTRILLDALSELGSYAPLDISAEFLAQSASEIADRYPALKVTPIVADFMAPIALPAEIAFAKTLIFFPGSTIGNLERGEALDLLRRLRTFPKAEHLILGIDLVKDERTLIEAYDDKAGVTARFNKNLLVRLNREAGADFDPDAFAHEARWNADAERIEMYLVSLRDQEICLGGRSFAFARGESLHTENSHKFTVSRLQGMAAASGWSLADVWTDANNLFAVAVLSADGP